MRATILFILFTLNFGLTVIFLGDIPMAVTNGDVRSIASISFIILAILFFKSKRGSYQGIVMISLLFVIISLVYTFNSVRAAQNTGPDNLNWLVVNIIEILTSAIALVFSYKKSYGRKA